MSSSRGGVDGDALTIKLTDLDFVLEKWRAREESNPHDLVRNKASCALNDEREEVPMNDSPAASDRSAPWTIRTSGYELRRPKAAPAGAHW